jgi:hypothetical protein
MGVEGGGEHTRCEGQDWCLLQQYQGAIVWVFVVEF